MISITQFLKSVILFTLFRGIRRKAEAAGLFIRCVQWGWDYWLIGLLAYRFIGLLAYRFIGLLAYWLIGL